MKGEGSQGTPKPRIEAAAGKTAWIPRGTPETVQAGMHGGHWPAGWEFWHSHSAFGGKFLKQMACRNPFLFAFTSLAKFGSPPLGGWIPPRTCVPSAAGPVGHRALLMALALPCSHRLEQVHVGHAPRRQWARMRHCKPAPHSTGAGLLPFSYSESGAQLQRPGTFSSPWGHKQPGTPWPSRLSPSHDWLQWSGSAAVPQEEEATLGKWRHWPHKCSLQGWRDRDPFSSSLGLQIRMDQGLWKWICISVLLGNEGISVFCWREWFGAREPQFLQIGHRVNKQHFSSLKSLFYGCVL